MGEKKLATHQHVVPTTLIIPLETGTGDNKCNIQATNVYLKINKCIKNKQKTKKLQYVRCSSRYFAVK